MAPGLGPNPWVELDRISRCVSLAVVAAEDQKFSRHFGFDFESLPDAVEDGLRGGEHHQPADGQEPDFLNLYSRMHIFAHGRHDHCFYLCECLNDLTKILA